MVPTEKAMVRKLFAHEQEFLEIIEVFKQDDELHYLSPDIEFPAEPNEITTTEEVFTRAQDTLKGLNVQWARGSKYQVEFFDHSQVLGSMAYGYRYVRAIRPESERSPGLPDLSYKRISKLGYGSYYKHIKGNWYLYVNYQEW